jgi:GT2 family glycosyltransferase
MRWIAGATEAPLAAYDADVVILALNRPEETVAAIDSALAQQGVARHVFVVDQGSRPATLARLAAAVADRPDATLVALDRNHGVAGGRNRGSALGRGRVIAALDNDAEFATADTLQHLVAALDADAGLGVVGCRIVLHQTGEDDLSSWGYPIGLLPLAGKSFDTATFVGAGHAIRRKAWLEAGGYDEALFFCWEEYDFALRAIACGWSIRYRGDLVVRHKVAAESRVSWSGERWFYFVRNRLYIGRKYGTGWLVLAPRVAGYLLKGLRNGLPASTVRAIIAAVRMAPARPSPSLAGTRPRHAGARYAGAEERGSWMTRLRREVFAPLPGLSVDRVRRTHRDPAGDEQTGRHGQYQGD